jgi:WXXGXW repeat (2 copies)
MRIVLSRSILPALLLLLALPVTSQAQIGVGVSITVAPPALPVYEQPPLPGEGYLWTPGFWQWGPDGYFWVPGTWVQPPSVGVLWTPGYWGWGEGAYVFHEGYWGPHIGFYGGVNYGFGYGGVGFEGGEWRGGGFFYNRAVMNVGTVHVTNVYNRTVIVNNTTRVSFNGGAGGVHAQPTPTEMSAAQEHHVARTAMQEQHIHAASTNHALLASVNHGAPAIAATPKPGVFSGKGVVTASHATPQNARTDRPPTAAHAAPQAPAVAHEAVAHPAGRPEGAAAERPEAKAMAAHPSAAAPHAAQPPHPAAAAPHPAAPTHAAPPAQRPEPPEDKRDRQ